MVRRKYLVRTRHPRGFRDGLKIVTVNVNPDGTRFVSGGGLGCSRNYRTGCDMRAVDCLLSEHAMMRVSVNYDSGEAFRLLDEKTF
jgi:hypothetical protein